MPYISTMKRMNGYTRTAGYGIAKIPIFESVHLHASRAHLSVIMIQLPESDFNIGN
jgi:hypothetical protein